MITINKPRLNTIYATPDAMLKAIHESNLGNGANKYDHLCQFCGYGRIEPFSQDHEHEPLCLWVQIEEYLKEIGRIL
jgi:hypothetical protein